ncbi:MAG TPA: bifunctional ADP-heptose synthase [Mucilaginibacter sp.]|jgi:D-beta-D-heptose 7-phosphate kinase/D-beta-D-heptose 1-phosphate adenosyltransferase
MTGAVSLLEKLKNVRVLVIGDIMLDHYLWGDVHRISPEAPVPVVHAIRDTYTAGGAANVALNLTNIGVHTTLIGHIATDEAGQRLANILSDNGVELINLNHNSDAPTIVKTRVIIRNQQLCRIDREVSRDKYQLDNLPDFHSVLESALNKVDAVIISDYAKGVITQPLINFILTKADTGSNFLVAIDPKPARKLSFVGAGLLTPNRQEALELAGLDINHDEEYPLEEVCSQIYKMYAPHLLVITLGAEGMAICKDGKVETRLATEAREVFDVSGAGDTVIATLAAALASGINSYQSASLANGAAGCVVEHMGTVPVKIEELQKWLENNIERFNV